MLSVYRVRGGESLSDIAKKLSTTVEKIKRLNGVSRAVEGERLLVNAIDGESYKVRPFDTLEKIAQERGVLVDEIRELNGITEVFFGEIIFLPCESNEREE